MNTGADPGFRSVVVADGAAADAIDLLRLARHDPQRYPFFLESAAPEPALARYDILFAFPGQTLQLTAGGLTGPHAQEASFLEALDSWWSADQSPDSATESLPFTGGWFVFLAYELAAQVEPSLHLTEHPWLPRAFATRIRAAVIHDRSARQVVVVAECSTECDAQLSALAADIEAHAAKGETALAPVHGMLREDQPERFLTAIRKAKRYIAAGDNFQTNLSRCWRVALEQTLAPADLYERLRLSNPAPFSGLLQQPDFAVIASSPERLVRRRGDRIDTRPIAGTRPRTEAGGDAQAQEHALLHNPKERAEHIMLIDLERNDLGRVCQGGTVKVDEYMVVESYAHVHHIVSNVTGQARSGLLPGDLLRAVFPGGTITGCPKVRSMEIINELERRPRGAYTGSMGYLNRSGDLDMNILIRTMTMQGKKIEIAAGSGIVADSIPTRELEETRAKAKGMLLALARPGDRVK